MKRTDLDLANRALGGSVRCASDEFFAPREFLIQPWTPVHDKLEFGPHGKIYDGWETRRRRTPGFDWVVVALGISGVLHEIVVDTAFFTGNYPPEISVEAAWLDGNASDDELAVANWVTVVPRSAASGNTANTYPVDDARAFSHVRLNIFPDGGVARLRVRGTPVPDARMFGGRHDLAALHNGGDIAECSNMFYSDARQVLHPGVARSMSEGWETARRRTAGNDYLVVTLAGPSLLSSVDLDTSYFLGNAPGRVRLSGRPDDESPWQEILPETGVSPDGHNWFRLPPAAPVSAVRVDVFPDGGFSRLRLIGELAPGALADAIAQWLRLLPSDAYDRVLTGGGLEPVAVGQLTTEQLAALAW